MAHLVPARELAFIDRPANYLENSSLIAAIADKVGRPVESHATRGARAKATAVPRHVLILAVVSK